jgi:type III restriction enzyme
MSTVIDNPVINSPFEPPSRHFEIGPKGPTGEMKIGRRPSESFVPIPGTRKGGGRDHLQQALEFEDTAERRERNKLINNLRRDVASWRQTGYQRVTPTTRNLLLHWADDTREERMLFCQREAAETAIFLAEVAGRDRYTDWRRIVATENDRHNEGLPRVALKMATGSGKTVVIAMLIAWQTLNKTASPRDARFAKRFLVVTPGITIRDRLRVVLPGDPGNYYDQHDLVPPDLRAQLSQAQIVITNYHAFLLRDAKEIRGVAGNTRKILLAGKKPGEDPFRETESAMVSRVLRDFGSRGSQEIVIFNDEAHHCYIDKPMTSSAERMSHSVSREEQEANEEARVWFRGIQSLARHTGVKRIYDLSATPFYLSGSGYAEGYLFPWTVSDFSLMDAIESGIVKIPRTPVDDDATGDLVTYRRLWDYIGDKLPRRRTAEPELLASWLPPPELEGALKSLYRSYSRSFDHWEHHLREHGEPPPVFIVVCPNTVVSKLVHDWIAGTDLPQISGSTAFRPGNLPLLSNTKTGGLLARPRTILVDSAQLESGEAMKAEFKKAARAEIELFKSELRRRNPGADVDQITDEDLLREVMNTVGKRGRLGEGVRCVVSVAMLTEGWDANTVTHILGVRAFRSQLLCEQVVGRGLRRRSYALNSEGHFDPEYASVYGIPFAFIPSERPTMEPPPRPPATEVFSVAGREHLRISFPRLEGYRVEIPDEKLHFSAEGLPVFEVGPSTVPTWTESSGIVGEAEVIKETHPDSLRPQEVAFGLAKRLLDTHFNPGGSNPRPWLFPRLLRICTSWLEECVYIADGYSLGYLLAYAERGAEAVEAIYSAITSVVGDRRPRLRPMLRRSDALGSTERVYFVTHKATEATTKSEISHVTLDGSGGNTWEQVLTLQCETIPEVAAYAKNDHLGFTIPYVYKGQSHFYLPDFLVRLRKQNPSDVERTLVVEVSGGRKSVSPGPTKIKADTARQSWCVAVNNHGGFGRWGYVEIKSMVNVNQVLRGSIAALYQDAPIIGDPELLDFSEVSRGA